MNGEFVIAAVVRFRARKLGVYDLACRVLTTKKDGLREPWMSKVPSATADNCFHASLVISNPTIEPDSHSCRDLFGPCKLPVPPEGIMTA